VALATLLATIRKFRYKAKIDATVLRGQTMRIALRPFDPADATERRRDEQDLARLRRRLRRDCTEQQLEAALADLSRRSDG
jgi:hypothetical protein